MTGQQPKTPLPTSYSPLPHTIVIGKGKVPANASGNKRLQSIVQRFCEAYSNAVHRTAKSSIVTDVMYAVEQESSDGISFVKYDGKHFYKATENQARDKICSTFRENLADRYKSSSKNKLAKRRQARDSKTNRISQSVQQLLSTAAVPLPNMPCNKLPTRAVSVLGSEQQHQQQEEEAPAMPAFESIPTFGVAAGLDHTFTDVVTRSVFDEATPEPTFSLPRISENSHTVSISRGSLLDDDDDEVAFNMQPSRTSFYSQVSL